MSVLKVIGIGADGWTGLGDRAREALRSAPTIVGSSRQLALLPQEITALRRPLTSPLEPALEQLAATVEDGTVEDGLCVLASGDPMLHGIGASLARRVDPRRLEVLPHPSAFALACARLGWPAAEVALVSAVARSPHTVVRLLQPSRRVIAYPTGADGGRKLANIITERGYGSSRFVVLERLGADDERITETRAASWQADADPLHTVAIEVRRGSGGPLLALTAGLPDDAYENDGQLTKQHVRASALAALAPTPGGVLWDVGSGSGSIAIEWLRAEATTAAIAIEPRVDRAARIMRNAIALGVPDRLTVVERPAPAALAGLPWPDAVFVGGGLAAPVLLAACWSALGTGGRLVANAVTLESEHRVVVARRKYGGTLTRIEVSAAEPLGNFTTWRPQLPIIQWAATKQ